MVRKLLCAVPLVFATAVVIWTGLSRPPPFWLLRYGPALGCEPTGREITVEGVVFVEFGPGYFPMGSSSHAGRGDLVGRIVEPLELNWGAASSHLGVLPGHWVEIPYRFAIARREVTNEEYERFAPGHRRSTSYPGDRHPAVGVTWVQAKSYCAWLADRGKVPMRLPSEVEWEAASEFLNQFGHAPLTDYLGADEWCEDVFHRNLDGAPTDGSAWTDGGSPPATPARVVRGGLQSDGLGSRAVSRRSRDPGQTSGTLGFRPAFSIPDR